MQQEDSFDQMSQESLEQFVIQSSEFAEEYQHLLQSNSKRGKI